MLQILINNNKNVFIKNVYRLLADAVKLVYNAQPRDHQKVAAVLKWPLIRGGYNTTRLLWDKNSGCCLKVAVNTSLL